jgi:predicted acyl esterase
VGYGRLRERLVVAGIAALILCAAAPAASATTPITDFFNNCPTYGDQQICSGQVPSFDGAKLDVDLTLPEQNTGTSHPLIVLLHGFGNNKHEWESTTDAGDGADKNQWNSHWFAKHGFYVLTYTARGFRDDGTDRSDEPDTPSFTSQDPPRGTIHLKSREFEARDTQWLAALVAAAYPDVARDQVAVSGGSYGGGESWLQASRPDWTFPHDQTAADPEPLPVLRLQVAVPKYPWTDLAYSLAPNGHPGFGPDNRPDEDPLYESSQCAPDDDVCAVGDGNPAGVVKSSYVNGFFAVGGTGGSFEEGGAPGPEEGPYSTTAWYGRLVPPAPGEPYDVPGDPLAAQIRRGLTQFRSSYYQDEGWKAQADSGREVAVFSIQGWTDDLFEAVESFREFKYLKRLDPKWPVALALGDIGHSRAQNLPDTWTRLNNQAWQFLQANIDGADKNQQTNVTSQPTVCAGANTPTQALTASTPEGLSAGTLTVAFNRSGSLTSACGLTDPNGPATDPIFGGTAEPGERCRTDKGPALGAYTAYSQPLKSTRTYIGLGWVTVPYTFTGQTGQLDTRVWDVPPGGKAFLMTRGTYRFSVPLYDQASGTIRLPLFGNHWVLTKGHRIRVDLTQVDQPYLRPSNATSAITFSPPRVVLPTRESGDVTLSGS